MIIGVIVVLAAAAVYVWLRPPPRANIVVADGGSEVVVMDFSRQMTLDPLPDGWHHRKFWTRKAATFSLAEKASVRALRFETDASASMLVRFVDVDLLAYPMLEWRWFVEKPIVSSIDERTRAGDDHPARLFITFQTEDGERRSMEIIWGNRALKAGEYHFLGGFPHYVANGGAANVGRWHEERVDLLRIYRRIWPGSGGARVVDVALFCDSDETETSSVAYFADIRMKKRR